MTRSPFSLLISVAIFVSAVATAPAAEPPTGSDSRPNPDRQEEFSPGIEDVWETRRNAIRHEIAESEDHRWAGEYHRGNVIAVNARLTLAPKSGFTYVWFGHRDVYRDCGRVITEQGHLKLLCEFATMRQDGGSVAKEWIPVRWGERRYLVPVDDVLAFCNAVNEGSEPRERAEWGRFFLGKDDHEVKVTGLPEVPEKYRANLLQEPIHATIIAVHPEEVTYHNGFGFHRIPLTLDVGSQDRVRVGMTFHRYERVPGGLLFTARVKSVDAHTCEALTSARVPGVSEIEDTQPPPSPGWKLWTRGRSAECDQRD